MEFDLKETFFLFKNNSNNNDNNSNGNNENNNNNNDNNNINHAIESLSVWINKFELWAKRIFYSCDNFFITFEVITFYKSLWL